MRIVLGKRAHPHQSVQCAGRFVAVYAAKLGKTQWQFAVAGNALFEYLYMARARGAGTVMVADISQPRLAAMEADHPDLLLDASKTDIVSEVRRHTGGAGADVIITANPDPVTQVQAVEMAKKGGRVLLFGGLPTENATPGINMNTVHYQALSLIGTTIFAPHHNKQALELIAGGMIPAERIISQRFALQDFKTGAELALSGKARKIVFTT